MHDDTPASAAALPRVRIEMDSGDALVVELYPDQAPLSVANFLALVDQGFYDGLVFHRVIRGFMIQGGCPLGTGTGGPGHTVKGEFSANGVSNSLRHVRGVLSMARSRHPDSAGSQFFIVHQDAPHLDGQYAAFGRVVEGLGTLDAIASARTGAMDRPVVPQAMRRVSRVAADS